MEVETKNKGEFMCPVDLYCSNDAPPTKLTYEEFMAFREKRKEVLAKFFELVLAIGNLFTNLPFACDSEVIGYDDFF